MIQIKRNIYKLLQLILLTAVFLFINSMQAQPSLPSRTITVLPTQPLEFGVFFIRGAGTLEVDFQGNITTTGGIYSLNTIPTTPAVFEIKLCQGRTVTLDYAYSVMLNGSNGGQLELIIGPTEKGVNGAEFAVTTNCDFITTLRVGGKLIVPANAVPGIYIGSFPMTFTQK